MIYDFDERYSTYRAMVHKVRIYQCDAPYKFMDYEFARSHGLNSMEAFNNDYKLVAEFNMKWEDEECYMTNMLGQLWNDGNDGTLQRHFKMHSISMSDVIEIDGHKHYVDTFGFVEMR